MLEINSVNNAIAIPIEQVNDHSIKNGIFLEDGNFCVSSKHRRSKKCSYQNEVARNDNQIENLSLLPNGIYGGIFFNHFGHFLVESIGRLWGLNDPRFISLPIYVFPLWGEIDLSEPNSFIRNVLSTLNIDVNRIKLIKETSLIPTLYIPKSGYDLSLLSSPDHDFLQYIRQATHKLKEMAKTLPRKKVYISRSRFNPARGFIAGEKEFESYLQRENYEIVYPEKLNFEDQLLTYLSADKIIIAEGSALHIMIFMPDITAKVAVIMRRNHSNALKTIIAQFKGINKNVVCLNKITKTESCGLDDFQGVSFVDLTKVSKQLQKYDYVDTIFKLSFLEERLYQQEALIRYAESIKGHPNFVSFLRTKEGICLNEKLKLWKINSNSGRSEAILFLSHVFNEDIFNRFLEIKEGTKETHDVFLLIDQSNQEIIDNWLSRLARFGLSDHLITFDIRTIESELGYNCLNPGKVVPGSVIFPIISAVKIISYLNYWVVEYDVFIKGSYGDFFSFFIKNNSDLICSHITDYKNDPNWFNWNTLSIPKNIKYSKDKLTKAFLPIFRISLPAIEEIDKALKAKGRGTPKFWFPHY